MNLLDLSNNLLKENAGMIIGKIISSHAGRRDEMKWAEEIRGDGNIINIIRTSLIIGIIRIMWNISALKYVWW